MAKAWVHSLSSQKRWGGEAEEYLSIHDLMDSSKSTIADSRHRALTHNAYFINVIIPKIFGDTFINSVGRTVSTKDVAEQHVLEDFNGRFIPSAQDYLEGIPMQDWMLNGRKGTPPSYRVIGKNKKVNVTRYSIGESNELTAN